MYDVNGYFNKNHLPYIYWRAQDRPGIGPAAKKYGTSLRSRRCRTIRAIRNNLMSVMTASGEKLFFESVEELAEPRHTALLLVDTQNDFLGRGGVVHRRGERTEDSSNVVARIKAVLERARALKTVVAYVRYTRTANNENESPASLRWMAAKRGYNAASVSAVEGTWGWNVVDDLAPVAGEIVINKRRASGFYQTDLELLLRVRGVQTVVVVGASTHGCVEATARDAEVRDFYVIVLSDCVAAYDIELHSASLTVMRSRYEVIPSERLLQAWQKTLP